MEALHEGISRFCQYWPDAPTLQQTFDSLREELSSGNDGAIDAAKAIVECACEVIISKIDDPNDPIRKRKKSPLQKKSPSINDWVSATVILLKLSEDRNDSFNKVISQYHILAEVLGKFRNDAGTLSHGKNGFSKKLSIHHRKTAVLSADAIITFLHEAYLEQQSNSIDPLEPFGRYSNFNSIIDNYSFFTATNIEDGGLLVKIAYPGGEVELMVNPSQLLFYLDRVAYKDALDSCHGLTDDNEMSK